MKTIEINDQQEWFLKEVIESVLASKDELSKTYIQVALQILKKIEDANE